MAKGKITGSIIIGIAIIVVGVLLYMGLKNGTFGQIYLSNNEIIEKLENPQAGSCTLSISPEVIEAGDQITGSILAEANTPCSVYANDGTGWLNIFDGDTDGSGRITQTEVINTVGTFNFRALCGTARLSAGIPFCRISMISRRFLSRLKPRER